MEQLDPQVVNLAKAIRQTETGGDFNAKGKSGEWGAYQYTPQTWSEDTKKYGLNYQFGNATPAQQNEVAYKKLADLKSKGYNVGQIASIWNSGQPEWEGKTGINKYGVKYDVPKYVNSVANAYQAFKAGQTSPQVLPNASTVQPEQKDGFLKSLAKGIIEPVATTLARPIQAGAELLGASAEDVNRATKNIAGDFVAPVPQSAQDVVKDVGRGAQTVALGLPVGTISGATKLGALAGAGAGLEQEGTLGGALKGGAVGAGTGFLGGTVSKAFESLPNWLAKNAYGLTDEQAQKMLATKSIGTKSGLVAQSDKSISTLGNKVRSLVSEADARGVKGSGNDAFRKTLIQFPEYNSEKGIQKFVNEIKDLIPAMGGLKGVDRNTVISAIDKTIDGTATLSEKNLVRSALDNATRKSWTNLMTKGTKPAFNKETAMLFARNLSGEVQAWVPESQPFFKELSKELNLNSILSSVTKKGGKGLIQWRDLVPYMAGSSIGGLPGGLATAATTRTLASPAFQFGLAKGIQGVGKAVTPVTLRAGLVSVFGK